MINRRRNNRPIQGVITVSRMMGKCSKKHEPFRFFKSKRLRVYHNAGVIGWGLSAR